MSPPLPHSNVIFPVARRLQPQHTTQQQQPFATATYPTTSSSPSPTTPFTPVTTDPWIVHKFGGSSVADAAQIRIVADIVTQSISENPSSKIFVVLSAVGGITNRILSTIKNASVRAHDVHYVEELDSIYQFHEDLARELLSATELESFLTSLRANTKDLKDLLRACWISRSVSNTIEDLIVGHGELWSCQLLWGLIRSSNIVCSCMDTRDVIVARPSEASAIRKVIEYRRSSNLLSSWLKDNPTNVVIATGFVCQDLNGFPTTLGRNGSDYTASIFGYLLNATEVQIWTDVDGIYSADPRVVKDAVVIPEISYKEAAELAYFGASVLHPDTMAPVISNGVPMRIRNTNNTKACGTWVRDTSNNTNQEINVQSSSSSSTAFRDMAGVKGFSTVQNVSLVNIEGTGMIGVPGIASRAFRALYEASVSVIVIAQASSEFSICIAIPSSQCEEAVSAIRTSFRSYLSDGLISSISTIPNCSILAIVGEKMQQRPGVSSRFFGSLTRSGVNIIAMAQGSSEHNISVVVDSNSESRALRAAHAAFYLSDQTVSLGLIGPGVVGAAFLQQVHSQLKTLDENFCVDLRVRGISTSKHMLFGDPIDLSTWRECFGAAASSELMQKTECTVMESDLDKFADYIQDTALPHAVICDCSASGIVSSYYEKWLERGIHIITPNKKANSGPMKYYENMRTAQRRLNSHFFYEANVGAGLPIISTVRDLLRTGDKFTEMEGIFSGTLSFIFNEFNGSEPFSSVVKKAKSNGYTEPDPRDDLSGMDVARKVVILAREIGMKIELEDVPVKSLVPSELCNPDTVSIDEFMKRLPDYDDELTKMAAQAKENGELLRYVGVIDAKKGECAVELRKYSTSHPFGRLQGSDNIVSFRTTRYDAQPLVIQGPGAGADVTAAGVFADLLRLTAYLGAPSAEDI